MGFLTLNSNERSAFQARELKSVTVNTQAALLKMYFHTNYQNEFNSKNQVGLIALNCIGPANGILPPTPQPQPMMNQTAMSNMAGAG